MTVHPDLPPEPLTVASGHVTALRLIDVAYSIDLARAEELCARVARPGGRVRLSGTPPKAMAFGEPPLRLLLPCIRLRVGEQEVAATATARLYAFGVVTFALRFAADGFLFREFCEFVNGINVSVGVEAKAAIWQELSSDLLHTVSSALERPSKSDLVEDYLVATVHAFDRHVPAVSLGTIIDLVPLLSGETQPLADSARADLLGRRLSYYKDDRSVYRGDRLTFW